jgi:lysozyme
MLSADLVESVKRHEGLRLRAYQDSVGVWTIGYGRNLQVMEIDTATAEKWLREDLEKYAKAVMLIPEVWKLTPARQDVLIEMAFNLGLKRLLNFTNMWAAIRAGNYSKAVAEMLDSKWATQVGTRSKTLADKFRKG